MPVVAYEGKKARILSTSAKRCGSGNGMATRATHPQEPFRTRLTTAERAAEYQRIRVRYPDLVPIIVERGATTAPRIDREKFLVPPTLVGAQLLYVVRRRLRTFGVQSLFLFTDGNQVVPAQTDVRSLHARHKSAEDGFLYLRYASEDAFGNGGGVLRNQAALSDRLGTTNVSSGSRVRGDGAPGRFIMYRRMVSRS